MANYPRELFESEKIAKEQIPLLFGDLKTVSASSVGSDKVEAAPTRSNRTEVTHSTNVSDQSQVIFFLFSIFIRLRVVIFYMKLLLFLYRKI